MLHNAESKFGHFRYRNQKFPRGDNLDKKDAQPSLWSTKLVKNLALTSRKNQAWKSVLNHPSTPKQPSNFQSVLKIALSVMGKSVKKLMIFKNDQIEVRINCIF